VAFPSAALVDARRARRDRDARVAARSAGGGASSRDSPTTTSDADACVFERGDVALLPNGARMRFVSRPDVQFLYDEIFVDECYAKHGLEIREGATVIDVGGNIGMFALYAARKAGTSGRVFAMEPIPKTFAALRENVTNNVEGFFSSSSSSPTSRGADDDVRRVACLDAKEAAAALRARNPSRARKKTNHEGSTPNVVAYNVGVSDGSSNVATFTFYPRAAGWSSLAPDDAETRDNVSRFARRRLSLRGDGDGDGDAVGDDASKQNASTKALHPLASLGAKLLAFAGGDDDDASSSTRTKNALNVADAFFFLRRGFVRVARAVARLAFSLAVSLVTAYLLGGKITRECPLVTVSDVIRANGLRVEYPSRDEKEGLSSVSTDDDSRRYAVDFLKIDVERGELAALRGIDEEHRGSIKQIAMEVHDGDGDGLQTVLDLLTAPTRVDERVGSGAGGFGFDKARVVAEQPDELLGGTLWNVYARR